MEQRDSHKTGGVKMLGGVFGIAVILSIFVARGSDQAESKSPYGEVRRVAAGEFAFWAIPSKRIFGITSEEYSA